MNVDMKFVRCTKCVMPTTRPDTAFVDGVCAACIAYEKRPQIDWEGRRAALAQLLDRHHGQCIVPSSGGKDSTYQVMTLLGMGADVTVVTAATCHLTPIGRANIDNLKRHARTIEISPNTRVRAQLNRMALSLVGDISWPEHVSIFTTPVWMALHLKIPLLFYGENPQNQYGGPLESQDARQMTDRWVSEYGGFLGMRPQDMVGMQGLTERDMKPYLAPHPGLVAQHGIERHFLGQYIEWDSHHNATVAIAAGMAYRLPSPANFWSHENLDNAQTGLHDHGMYRKFGYGRLAAQVSVDVRAGHMTRDAALELVNDRDGTFPFTYAGVTIEQVIDRIGITAEKLRRDLDAFTNWDLFRPADEHTIRPILKS